MPFAFGQTDAEGSKDYPGISRMPGYYIDDYRAIPFDAYKFKVAVTNTWKEESVEGRRINIRYNLKDGAEAPSQLQILRNYQNAARAKGGKVLYSDDEDTTIRFSKDGKEIWLSLQAGNAPSGTPIFMTIVEKEAMQQDVTIDADGMARDIGETGKVAIYGILFDTGRADLKPESSAALNEIAKLLNAKPELRVYVVGHTDMTADLATNLKLSQARAQAVVTALVSQHGISAARLIPYGDGPYAPVATNRTEEGRAKNRRVELVEIATK
jgi:outer membrane protein OmpA-like peptidoglycan-associated protein